MTSTSDGVDLAENEGSKILAAILVTWIVALVVLVLRFVARRISHVGYWADDWLIAAAFVFHSGLVGLFIGSVVMGAGRHRQALTESQFNRVELSFFVAELIFSIAVNLPKLSVLAFYWRIFSASRAVKMPIIVTGTLVIIWIVLSVFILIFQCNPVKKLAHPEIPGHCLDKWSIFVGGSIPNLVLDVIVLCIPIPFIWNLHARLGRRLLLGFLFLLGGFACVSSALRLWAFVVRDYDSPDLTWTTIDPIIWSCVEVAIAIISGCLLSLRPILTYVTHGSIKATTRAEQSFTYSRRKSNRGRTLIQRGSSVETTTSPRTINSLSGSQMIAPMAWRDDDENLTALPSLGPMFRPRLV